MEPRTNLFWVCNCEKNYVLPSVLSFCSRCGANKDLVKNCALVAEVMRSPWIDDWLESGELEYIL